MKRATMRDIAKGDIFCTPGAETGAHHFTFVATSDPRDDYIHAKKIGPDEGEEGSIYTFFITSLFNNHWTYAPIEEAEKAVGNDHKRLVNLVNAGKVLGLGTEKLTWTPSSTSTSRKRSKRPSTTTSPSTSARSKKALS